MLVFANLSAEELPKNQPKLLKRLIQSKWVQCLVLLISIAFTLMSSLQTPVLADKVSKNSKLSFYIESRFDVSCKLEKVLDKK